jgi:hypothetical protein
MRLDECPPRHKAPAAQQRMDAQQRLQPRKRLQPCGIAGACAEKSQVQSDVQTPFDKPFEYQQ